MTLDRYRGPALFILYVHRQHILDGHVVMQASDAEPLVEILPGFKRVEIEAANRALLEAYGNGEAVILVRTLNVLCIDLPYRAAKILDQIEDVDCLTGEITKSRALNAPNG